MKLPRAASRGEGQIRRVHRIWERLEREELRKNLRKNLKGRFPTIQSVRAMFRRFNRLYFRDQLAGWQVRYEGRWPWDRPAHLSGLALEFSRGDVLGDTDHATKTIHVRRGLESPTLASVVLHEMIHATGVMGHDRAFRAELHRIEALGEPSAKLARDRQ